MWPAMSPADTCQDNSDIVFSLREIMCGAHNTHSTCISFLGVCCICIAHDDR